MRPGDLARLTALAIIWSLSFVFLRVIVPALGPMWTATLRVLIAGAALVAWFAVTHLDADVRRNWRAYLFVGALNSALPFVLFAFAAQHLPASYLVILNAATPMFAALAAAAWLGDRLTPVKLAGLALGAAGVTLVSRAGPVTPDATFALAVAASLGAALCYAIAGVWLKRHGAHLKSVAVAGWSQLFASLVLLPGAAATSIPATPTMLVLVDLLALALVCSGVAYLLYYRLIADVGPTRAMTVTFLMPAFGMAWGALFLGERITSPMVAGAAMIIAGTAAVLRVGAIQRARA
ncbi:MAG TPA: DMT family transporter [Casimicrobiaceae bacterium]|nr:DMT family transporter [Casimicrobiaceae bacterium]